MSSNMRPNWYDRHVLPYLLDFVCGIRPVWRQRHKVVPLAEGRVLEIGIGTGLNFEHYDKARIEKIVGLDPGLEMHLSLIHISEPTRLGMISYAVFCLK